MKRILSRLFVFFLVLACTTPVSVRADETEKDTIVVVRQEGGVFLTEEEEDELRSAAINYSLYNKVSLIYLISSDTDDKSPMVYSDDYLDMLIEEYNLTEDNILVFVDLDNGYDYVNTTGTAIENISDYEIECILDDAFEVPEDDYYGRLVTMMKSSFKAFEENDDSVDWDGSYNYAPDAFDIFKGVASSVGSGALLGGAVLAGCLVAHSAASKKLRTKTLGLKWDDSGVNITDEDFVRTYTTVKKGYYRQSSSSGSGSSSSRSRSGGSSHRSSSGCSHGGGGRRR